MNADYIMNGFEVGAALIFILVFFILAISLSIISIIIYWKIFEKAGKPGWASLIPFYNAYLIFEICGFNGWMFLLMMIPFVNMVFLILLNINLAKVFGKDGGFAIGLLFLNIIFLGILAFGNSTYNLSNIKQKSV